MKKVEIWAHRGASAYAPENTLDAFRLAIEMGADGIELDVQLTKDDEIVVIHDETLQRVSNGTGYVRDYTLEELRVLNFNKTHPEYEKADIPTLREVLQLLQDTDLKLNIELKTGVFFYPNIEQKVVDMVVEYGMQDRVWYSSFNHYSVKEVKRLQPRARVGLLYGDGIYEPAEYAARFGAEAIHPHIVNLEYPDVLERCREKGIKVHAWTANTYQDMARCIRYGVDALITNYPDKAKLLAERQGEGRYPFENPFEMQQDREFYLFGAGYNGQHFLKRFAGKYVPDKILDNAEAKWGDLVEGIMIESPQCLKATDCVVIAGIYYVDIVRQLKAMGVSNYYIYDETSDWH